MTDTGCQTQGTQDATLATKDERYMKGIGFEVQGGLNTSALPALDFGCTHSLTLSGFKTLTGLTRKYRAPDLRFEWFSTSGGAEEWNKYHFSLSVRCYSAWWHGHTRLSVR
ncbi:MAG: hypothetical protein OZ917_03800 [Candidatus Brocadiaceae bacterium]|nr:hypothetical protein [Candidatus Brocadiaceae bacterium]